MAETAYFLALVPPAEIGDRILQLMHDHELSGFDPHITVKAQVGLADPDRWLPAVEQYLSQLAPLTLRLGQPGWFGEEVLFLTVEGDVRRIHTAVLDALDAAGIPERWEYDGAEFDPHLTLGAEWAGATRQQLRNIAVEAAAWNLKPFVAERVNAFQRAGWANPYLPWREFRLGTSSHP